MFEQDALYRITRRLISSIILQAVADAVQTRQPEVQYHAFEWLQGEDCYHMLDWLGLFGINPTVEIQRWDRAQLRTKLISLRRHRSGRYVKSGRPRKQRSRKSPLQI